MSTESYRKKRRLEETPEPRGNRGRKDGKPKFVVQHHDASTDHYDFRLEADGALKSWAVPKGPSTDPRVKRLAIPVEDHPLDYADFEDVIPEGHYGAGTVMVWDRGTYDYPVGKEGDDIPSVAEAIDEGHLVVRLNGEKLTGGYALQRTGSGKDARWLLVKTDDEAADARRSPVSSEPKSVLSGRTMHQIARDSTEPDK